MKIRLADFDPRTFSFHDDPVLVLEEFWTPEEMATFRRAMAACRWTGLRDMPNVQKTFEHCGNWIKADLESAERSVLVERTLLPCVSDYIESFDNVTNRVMSFHYYAYAAGDSLSLHDDTDSGDPQDARRDSIRRRLALTTYVHESWDPNWGGELITYAAEGGGTPDITHCILPKPGSLVIFTVPRLHRVCRVDPLAGPNRRLSLAGWFMTEH